jgi:hypothetical protein
MRKVRSIVGRDPCLDSAPPYRLTSRDPYAGDEALLWKGSYENYLLHMAWIDRDDPMGPEQYQALDLEFELVYRRVLDGDVPWSAIEDVAAALMVNGPLRHDRRPAGVAEEVVSDEQMSDITENQLPQVGLVAPDRFLGPWADEPLPRWVRVQVAAAMMFVPELDPGVPAWARRIKRKPMPSAPVRQSVRVISRTPPMVWKVDGDHLEPLLPLGERFMPCGPIAGIPDVPAVIGRVIACEAGSYLAAGLPLIRLPPVSVIERRLRLELLRLRRGERRLSWEDVLRERGEVLYRSCFEWLWLQLANGDSPPW